MASPITKLIQLLLPAKTSKHVTADAAEAGIDEAQVCTKIIVDYYDALNASQAKRGAPPVTKELESPDQFKVGQLFPEFPHKSVRLTESFLNEVSKILKIEGLQKRNRSIIIIPRVARIDYLLSKRALTPGLVVTFFGNLEQFDDPRGLLKSGPKSYVRVHITSREQLQYCRRFIRQAVKNRFGSLPHQS